MQILQVSSAQIGRVAVTPEEALRAWREGPVAPEAAPCGAARGAARSPDVGAALASRCGGLSRHPLWGEGHWASH